jgi:hypothetical protein
VLDLERREARVQVRSVLERPAAGDALAIRPASKIAALGAGSTT